MRCLKTLLRYTFANTLVKLIFLFYDGLSVEIANHHTYNSSKLPIVYVYTVVPAVCKYGLPGYLKISLEQALLTQPDCDVVMASNYAECPQIMKLVENIPNLIYIDTKLIESNRTKRFNELAVDIFQTDRFGQLWITSALRFFNMEDIMTHMNYTEMVHVEGDNMLYGRFTSLLPLLRQSYKGLAATPLLANRSFITASVFWISGYEELKKFTDFLFAIATRVTYQNYLTWLRRWACCKKGGIDPDANGNGIKPFAVNEMSMLAYYHALYPETFKLFPVVPHQTFILNRYVTNMSEFGPGGRLVGPETNDGIWDPNSWGQKFGGTHFGRGRDKGFRDPSHIVGQALGTTGCNITMECSPQSNNDTTYETGAVPYYVTNNGTLKCLTAPYVRCTGGPITRLWNLHVHSKHTHDYMSQPCDCDAYVGKATMS